MVKYLVHPETLSRKVNLHSAKTVEIKFYAVREQHPEGASREVAFFVNEVEAQEYAEFAREKALEEYKEDLADTLYDLAEDVLDMRSVFEQDGADTLRQDAHYALDWAAAAVEIDNLAAAVNNIDAALPKVQRISEYYLTGWKIVDALKDVRAKLITLQADTQPAQD